MLYLILAILSSMLVSVFMRLSGKYTGESANKLAMNYVMCCLLAYVFSGGMTVFPSGKEAAYTLGLGAINGLMYLGAFLLFQWNISQNGVVLPSTFMKLGVIVPTLLAILVFGENPRWNQAVGILLAIAAIFIIQGTHGTKNTAVNMKGLLLLLVVGGSADGMSKVFEQTGDPSLKEHFLLYTFGFALLLCVILCIVKKERFGWKDALFGLLIGIPNYFSARFLLASLAEVPAMVAYPTFSVGTIVLVALAGILFFKEKLNRRKLAGLGVILAALVLLNV